MLKIVERELTLGPGLDKQELERLTSILNRDGTLAELNTALCEKLKNDEIDYQGKALVNHLRLTAMGKLSIDNPEYSAYKRALDKQS